MRRSTLFASFYFLSIPVPTKVGRPFLFKKGRGARGLRDALRLKIFRLQDKLEFRKPLVSSITKFVKE